MLSNVAPLIAALAETVLCHPLNGSPHLESATDSWAAPLADIGPLIMLVGERSTKQLLRDVDGFWSAFSLAAAPLGLISVVSSLIRIGGPHRLRALIGYELEPRSVAAMEITHINCNGVHAQLIEGQLIRTTHPTREKEGGVLGVSFAKGKFTELRSEVETQLAALREFEALKKSRHIPETEARVNWCLVLSCRPLAADQWEEVFKFVAAAVTIPANSEKLDRIKRFLKDFFDKKNLGATVAQLTSEKSNAIGSSMNDDNSNATQDQVSFMFTFDAISELCTIEKKAWIYSFAIGVFSFIAIAALYLVEISVNSFRLGTLLVIIGYVGIIGTVTLAALHIESSNTRVPLNSQSMEKPQTWTDGAVKAEELENKSGVELYRRTSRRPLHFEAVCIRPQQPIRQAIASIIIALLPVCFVCHYIGLRSSSWWLVISELGVCLIAAFARSTIKTRPDSFLVDTPTTGQTIDWRCCSTGIIDQAEADIVKNTHNFQGLNFRVYSEQPSIPNPKIAERVAWQTAQKIDMAVADWLLQLTGIVVEVFELPLEQKKRAVIAGYYAGILVKDGLASPNTYQCTAFCASLESLACPTPYLSRTITRQRQWCVENSLLSDTSDVLSQYYIPPLSSIAQWWGVAELRNGLEDYHENLQWACLYANISYFVALRRNCTDDEPLMAALEAANSGLDDSTVNEASDTLTRYLTEKWSSENHPDSIANETEPGPEKQVEL